MRRILCYGDSNTWGYTPSTGERFPPEVRWTGVTQRLLGNEYTLIEEGMNGRTTVYDNPTSPGRDGSAFLLTCLVTQKPLDLVVLMLGTNDLRWTDAWGAAEGAKALIKRIRLYSHLEESTPIFPSGPRVLLVAPIQAHSVINGRDVIERWRRYPEKSEGFAAAFAAAAKELGVHFLDAAACARPSEADGIHMTAESHAALGQAVARRVKDIFGEP